MGKQLLHGIFSKWKAPQQGILVPVGPRTKWTDVGGGSSGAWIPYLNSYFIPAENFRLFFCLVNLMLFYFMTHKLWRVLKFYIYFIVYIQTL